MTNSVSVQSESFDLAAEYHQFGADDAGIGAVVAFVGRVRDLNLDRNVVALSLEHYPGMTEKALQRIADEAAIRWPLNAVRVVHRVGDLKPTDDIVLVLTASPHRKDAYEANQFIMDYLKTRAPFWKKEHGVDGEARWVDARDSDYSALERWEHALKTNWGIVDHD